LIIPFQLVATLVKHGSSNGDGLRYAASSLICILDFSDKCEKLYRGLAAEVNNTDDPLAAMPSITLPDMATPSRRGRNGKGVDSGSQNGKRYDYVATK